MKKSILLFIFLRFFLCIAYFFVIDEPLNNEIAETIAYYNNDHQLENNGSIYQLGLWAELNSSPYQVGLWRIKTYKKALQENHGKVENFDFEDYPANKTITEIFSATNRPNLLCNMSEYECLNYIYHKTAEVTEMRSQVQPYIERYEALLNYTTFTLFEKPSFALPVPTFGPSSDMLQLKILTTLEKIQQQEIDLAITELASLIQFQKLVLTQTPYMAPKIASIIELEMLINISAFLIAKAPKELLVKFTPIIKELDALSDEQLSMKKAFLHEFVAQVNTLENMAIKTQDFSDELPGQYQWLPLSVLYKKNKTINRLYQAMTSNIGLISYENNHISQKPAPDIDQFIEFDYRNPIGSMLINDLIPKRLNLEAFIYQVDVKQRMVNYLFQQKKSAQKINPENFINPFTDDKAYIAGNEFCLAINNSADNDLCLAAF